MTGSHSHVPDDRIPVIVGVGEIADHPAELTAGLEPLALLEAAVKRAGEDAGAALLGEIDSLDLVNFLSWRYRDPEQQLAARLGIKPPHCFYGPVGGESPIRYLHEAAQRIARGETKVAVVCGAEAQSTATKAERAGVELPWTPFAHDVLSALRIRHRGALGPDAARGIGGIRRALVALFGRCGRQSAILDEAPGYRRHHHEADAG